MRRSRRSGISLLEVMLATAVLLGSVAVLSHIAFVGTAHMDSARQYSAAQLACQARMNEMLAGARPIEEVSNQRIPELPGWRLSVKVGSADKPGLLAIEVTAAQRRKGRNARPLTEPSTVDVDQTLDETLDEPFDESSAEIVEEDVEETLADTTDEEATGKQFTLVRWIVDPDQATSSTSTPTDELGTPPQLPTESSFFDSSPIPGAEQPMPGGDQPMPPGEPFMPEEPPFPEEPGFFDEPLP